MKATQIVLLTGMLLMPFAVQASTTGSCAPVDENGHEIGSCTWTLDGDTLTFSGTGPMKDYGTVTQNNIDTTDAPWNDRNNDYHTGSLYQIRNVIIEDGITNIGNQALAAAKNLSYISIGNGVKTVGDYAFYYAGITSLQVDFGQSVETLGQYAFHSCAISDIILPESLKSMGTCALRGNGNSAIVLPDSLEKIDAVVFSRDVQSLVLPAHLIDKNGISSTSMLYSGISKLYCPKEKESFCINLIEEIQNREDFEGNFASNISYGTYEKKGNRYIFDGTTYKSVADYYHHEPVKRIYTIDEANKVSKPTGNTFKIRYK